ncbi:MAG TPA: VC0807 family protein [Caulobacteraceae bacterium]|nr:VC0807 family protein [Caulobacteraceae bacterium]
MDESRTFRSLRALLIDVVAPVVAYFGLRALGVAVLPALLAGGGVAALDAVLSLIIQRRLRPLPIFACCTFALTGTLAYLSGDPRLLLLKPSIASAAIGLFLLALACLPSTLDRLLSPLIARGSELRAAHWRTAWDTRPPLRRTMRLACLLAGLAVLAEAAARAAVVFSFTVGQSLFLAHGPAVILVIVLIAIARFMVAPAVTGAMADDNPDPKAPGAA